MCVSGSTIRRRADNGHQTPAQHMCPPLGSDPVVRHARPVSERDVTILTSGLENLRCIRFGPDGLLTLDAMAMCMPPTKALGSVPPRAKLACSRSTTPIRWLRPAATAVAAGRIPPGITALSRAHREARRVTVGPKSRNQEDPRGHARTRRTGHSRSGGHSRSRAVIRGDDPMPVRDREALGLSQAPVPRPHRGRPVVAAVGVEKDPSDRRVIEKSLHGV